MRDDEWLAQRMNQIWELLFPEVDRMNNVVIRFKGKWKNKFGHIKRLKNKDTEIAINGLFKHEQVPEYMIDTTIAHELIHYWHGFNSPYTQKYKHPHAGGIVTREMKNRGFGHMIAKEREFVKRQWMPIYNTLCPEKKPRRRRFSWF
jgi:hypothetical protein